VLVSDLKRSSKHIKIKRLKNMWGSNLNKTPNWKSCKNLTRRKNILTDKMKIQQIKNSKKERLRKQATHSKSNYEQ
jgi:hypothetical protein